jgi:hypothetical protein
MLRGRPGQSSNVALARSFGLSLSLALLLPVVLVFQATVEGPVFGALSAALAMLAFALRWGIDVGLWAGRALRRPAPAVPRP